MALVRIPSRLRHLTDGRESVDVEAADVRQLVRSLDARFPGLARELGEDTAVAIDGEIVNDPMLEAVGPDSEVDFLPRISGG